VYDVKQLSIYVKYEYMLYNSLDDVWHTDCLNC